MAATSPLLAGWHCVIRVLREVLWFTFILLKAFTFGLAAAWDTFGDTILEAVLERAPKATAQDIEELRRAFYANASREIRAGHVADFPRDGRGRGLSRSA